MDNTERAKNQVMEQCFDTPIEEQGLNMLKHYEYLTTLNHEWSSMCDKAIRSYIPNMEKIKALEVGFSESAKMVQELQAKNEELMKCVTSISKNGCCNKCQEAKAWADQCLERIGETI